MGTSNLTSYELYAILIEEDRRRKDKGGYEQPDNDDNPRTTKRKKSDTDNDVALATMPNKRKFADRIGPKKCGICKKPGHRDDQCWHKAKTCFNCKKPGHMKEDCWCPGGGKEGQGPSRGRGLPNPRFKAIANVTTTSGITEISDDLMDDIAFMADDGLEYVDSEQSEERMIWYEWVADSGATSHIVKSKTVMTDYVPLTSRRISGIGNESLNAIGQGTVHLINYIGKTKISFTLKNVLHVPHASHNLVSISRLDKDGGHAHIKNGMLNLFSKDGKQFAQAKMERGLYIMNSRAKLHQTLNCANSDMAHTATWEDWHKNSATSHTVACDKSTRKNSLMV